MSYYYDDTKCHNNLITINFLLAVKNWNVLLEQTKMKGPWVTKGEPIPATIAFYLANEETWIIGVKNGGYLKMVKLKVTGPDTYDWIGSKHRPADSCANSFLESCFDGTDVPEDKYEVQLVAEQATLD